MSPRRHGQPLPWPLRSALVGLAASPVDDYLSTLALGGLMGHVETHALDEMEWALFSDAVPRLDALGGVTPSVMVARGQEIIDSPDRLNALQLVVEGPADRADAECEQQHGDAERDFGFRRQRVFGHQGDDRIEQHRCEQRADDAAREREDEAFDQQLSRDRAVRRAEGRSSKRWV